MVRMDRIQGEARNRVEDRGCVNFAHELDAWRAGAWPVAGVDEAGRGPLAGPVTAAAVILNARDLPPGINDSKAISPAARERAAAGILRSAQSWAVAHVWLDEIERLNIHHASHLAMCRALAALDVAPALALIDGKALPRGLVCPGVAIVGGDATSLSIAAASILAKTARDRIMVDLAQQFPGYGWDRNAGYPTREHREAIRSLGITPYHRRSFPAIHKILCRDEISSA